MSVATLGIPSAPAAGIDVAAVFSTSLLRAEIDAHGLPTAIKTESILMNMLFAICMSVGRRRSRRSVMIALTSRSVVIGSALLL